MRHRRIVAGGRAGLSRYRGGRHRRVVGDAHHGQARPAPNDPTAAGRCGGASIQHRPIPRRGVVQLISFLAESVTGVGGDSPHPRSWRASRPHRLVRQFSGVSRLGPRTPRHQPGSPADLQSGSMPRTPQRARVPCPGVGAIQGQLALGHDDGERRAGAARGGNLRPWPRSCGRAAWPGRAPRRPDPIHHRSLRLPVAWPPLRC